MKISTMLQSTAASAALLVAAQANAGSVTNTMTNIVTVADACDVVATGVDFGITTIPLPATGIPSILANDSVGNAVTGNAGLNPSAGSDGGAGDTLSLTTPIAAVNTVINGLLSAINVSVPGVYVVCTTTPTAITLTSGANNLSLDTAIAAFSGTFNSTMTGVGGGATGSNAISYSLTIVGTPVSTAVAGLPVNVFTAAFVATGLIPASQTGNTIVPGYYSDTATAQVDF